MIILNFSHPLTPAQLDQVESLTSSAVDQVLDMPCQIDIDQPLIPQVAALVDGCGISSTEWQTLPLLVVPPALNFVAVVLLAELHGRCGYFPAHLRLRPVAGSIPRRFELAEVLDLQTVRDGARAGRV